MKTRDFCLCGLFASILCVCATFTIPLFFTPIAFTLQVFAVGTAAVVLGGKKAAASVAIYIFMGAIGLPVFSGMKGGIGILAGATGGYIWGFAIMAFVSGTLIEKLSDKKNSFAVAFLSLVLGLAILYCIGTIQFAAVTKTAFLPAVMACVVPFIPFDIAKLVLAYAVSVYIKKYAFAKE